MPGCVAGWDALRRRFGTKSFPELLASAVFYAENGFPLPEIGARRWISQSAAQQAGLPGDLHAGRPAAAAWRHLQESARSANRSGRSPPRAATAITRASSPKPWSSFSQEQGGAHTLEDFAEFEPEWVEPISTTYRGWQVYELPPNGQGVAALSMLNIMENFPLKDYGHNSAAALHVMIEAKKLAYADMARYVGDPRFGPVPVPRDAVEGSRENSAPVWSTWTRRPARCCPPRSARAWTRAGARPSICRPSTKTATSSR